MIIGTSLAQSSSGLRPEHPLRRWALLPTDYGIFCWMFALLGWPLLFVIAYGAMFLVNVVVLFPVLAKWWRELRRYGSYGVIRCGLLFWVPVGFPLNTVVSRQLFRKSGSGWRHGDTASLFTVGAPPNHAHSSIWGWS